MSEYFCWPKFRQRRAKRRNENLTLWSKGNIQWIEFLLYMIQFLSLRRALFNFVRCWFTVTGYFF